MKFSCAAVCGAVVSCGMVFSAGAQINLKSNTINFREYNNAANATTHYGDLDLSGGSQGTGWGWLYCNRVLNDGGMVTYGFATFYGGLNVAGGTKNFIQPHPTDTNKVIKYICIEAGEAMTMVRGLSKTSGGSVVVTLPEHFGLVTSDIAPITVLITPENAPVLLYAAAKSRVQITVVMKPADFKEYGDADFAWQVSGVRDGYENEKIICNADSLLGGIENDAPVSEKRAKMNERTKKMMEKSKELAKNKKK